MGRPRRVEEGRIVAVYLHERLYEALKAESARKGVSLSELVRTVLERGLAMPDAGEGAPADPPGESASEKLKKIEEEELREAVAALEKNVAQLEARCAELKRVGFGYRAGSVILMQGGRVLNVDQERRNLASAAIGLKKRWWRLRKWYEKLRVQDEETGEKLVEIYEKLKAILNAVSG